MYLILFLSLFLPFVLIHNQPVQPVTIAIIGDYGYIGPEAEAVSKLVKLWTPDAIVTTGDNLYGTGKYADVVGHYYGNYTMFPSMGNHDWDNGNYRYYMNYFGFPRYYDVVQGPIHFFILDSDPREPNGVTVNSIQAHWLYEQLIKSDATWKIVILHHPPYSSDSVHGSMSHVQWPYAEWGADIIISGHSHTYERIEYDGIVYIVNGLGGNPKTYNFGLPLEGSVIRITDTWGAQRITATSTTLCLKFITIDNIVRDIVILDTVKEDIP